MPRWPVWRRHLEEVGPLASLVEDVEPLDPWLLHPPIPHQRLYCNFMPMLA